MSAVANRYVEALYQLAKSDDEKDKFEQGLKEVAIVFNSNDEFRKLLYDPRIDNEIKIEVIKEVFSEYAQGVFVNFLKVWFLYKAIIVLTFFLFSLRLDSRSFCKFFKTTYTRKTY